MWRELVIRRLRFDFFPFPFDFEAFCREAQDSEPAPDIFTLMRFGSDSTWETMTTGVRNPTCDGDANLDWEDPVGGTHGKQRGSYIWTAVELLEMVLRPKIAILKLMRGQWKNNNLKIC